MWIHFIHQKQRTSRESGFSIIELIVAIAIFILLSSTFLINYNTFNKRTTLDTLAQQIAQWAREAQVASMSIKNSKTQLGTFLGYGLHFDIATPDRFVYFADLNGDKRYDPPVSPAKCGDAGVECERKVLLLKGNFIDSLCGDAGLPIAPSPKCVTVGALDTSTVFDITFPRPNPDAVILGNLLGLGYPVNYARARITVSSLSGHTRTIEVWVTGQISVQ